MKKALLILASAVAVLCACNKTEKDKEPEFKETMQLQITAQVSDNIAKYVTPKVAYIYPGADKVIIKDAVTETITIDPTEGEFKIAFFSDVKDEGYSSLAGTDVNIDYYLYAKVVYDNKDYVSSAGKGMGIQNGNLKMISGATLQKMLVTEFNEKFTGKIKYYSVTTTADGKGGYKLDEATKDGNLFEE